VRREHEDAHAVLAAHGVFGRRTGVAGGGAEDVDFSPRFSSTYSNRLPSNCMAMSLKASVGPLDSSSRASPGSSQRTGVMSPPCRRYAPLQYTSAV
jgi:hypothetical protein